MKGYGPALMVIASGLRGWFHLRSRPPKNPTTAALLRILAIVFVVAGIAMIVAIAMTGSARLTEP